MFTLVGSFYCVCIGVGYLGYGISWFKFVQPMHKACKRMENASEEGRVSSVGESVCSGKGIQGQKAEGASVKFLSVG